MWQCTALILHTVLYYLHFLPIVLLTSKCHVWNFFSDMKIDYATSYPTSQKLDSMDIAHSNTRVIFSLHLFLTWLICQPSWMHHLNYTKILYKYALRQKSWNSSQQAQPTYNSSDCFKKCYHKILWDSFKSNSPRNRNNSNSHVPISCHTLLYLPENFTFPQVWILSSLSTGLGLYYKNMNTSEMTFINKFITN